MRQIKVLEVSYSLKAAGIESFVTSLIEHLPSSKIETTVLVYSSESKDMFFEDRVLAAGAKIVSSESDKKHSFLTRHLIRRFNYYKYLRNNNYDIVHIHASSGLQGLEVLIARLAGVPVIVTHSHSSGLGKSSKLFALKVLLDKIGKFIINNLSDVKIACSDNAAKWLFYDRSAVHIINNGIDAQKYRYSEEARRSVRMELGIAEDTTVIGHIGSFSPIKNHKKLLDIFYHLNCQMPNSRLLLIGDGELKEDIIRQAKQAGIQDAVILTGTRADCNKLLSSMDALVFPSLWEGFPMTLIEAQATGLPCVIADSITRQIDITGAVAFLSIKESSQVWANKIINLIMNDRESDRRKRAQIAYNSDYSIEKATHSILEIYLSSVKVER